MNDAAEALDLDGLSVEQLKRVVERAKERIETLSRERVHVGQRVRFEGGRHEGMLRGTIEKVNRKTVSVTTDSGVGWRLGFSDFEPIPADDREELDILMGLYDPEAHEEVIETLGVGRILRDLDRARRAGRLDEEREDLRQAGLDVERFVRDFG